MYYFFSDDMKIQPNFSKFNNTTQALRACVVLLKKLRDSKCPLT